MAFVASLSALLVVGCGARTVLDVDPSADGGRPFDGGRDAGVDGGPPDAGDPDAGGLFLDCGRSEQFTTPRRPVTVSATADSPDGIVSVGWEVVAVEPGSDPVVDLSVPQQLTITPDVEGSYELRFNATDGAGRMGSCSVTVQAVIGPPVALCPEEELTTTLGVPVLVLGDGFDDDMVVDYRWDVVDAPPGATPMLSSTTEPVIELTASVRGRYTLRLTVTDVDMAMDSCEVAIVVTGPPEVMCPPDVMMAPTRVPVSVTASATDDVGIRARLWEMITRPAGSAATHSPADRDRTTFTPDRAGRYVLRFTATDIEGLTASCEVNVHATPTPPVVTCPESVSTAPLRAVAIAATAVDDGTIVSWSWTTTSRPPGSAAGSPSPRTAAATSFTPDVAGVYEVTVTARDNDGMTGTCTTQVLAGNVDGLRVEMTWNTTSTDMDLHLMNPTGTRWGMGNDDCNYQNCNTNGGPAILSWGAPGDEDDPRLDIDDINGQGPENINITAPQPGTYRVGVHNYGGRGPNQVTVRVYCGGSTTTPRQVFGPVALREHTGSNRDFWRVADVNISASGCTITDLTRPDGAPWIERWESTQNMR